MPEQHADAVASLTLDQLGVGKRAVIREVGGEGPLRQHFLDMGVIPGAYVEFVKQAPMGDPLELSLRGYQLSLRRADADSQHDAQRIVDSRVFPKVVVKPEGKIGEQVDHDGYAEYEVDLMGGEDLSIQLGEHRCQEIRDERCGDIPQHEQRRSPRKTEVHLRSLDMPSLNNYHILRPNKQKAPFGANLF